MFKVSPSLITVEEFRFSGAPITLAVFTPFDVCQSLSKGKLTTASAERSFRPQSHYLWGCLLVKSDFVNKYRSVLVVLDSLVEKML